MSLDDNPPALIAVRRDWEFVVAFSMDIERKQSHMSVKIREGGQMCPDGIPAVLREIADGLERNEFEVTN